MANPYKVPALSDMIRLTGERARDFRWPFYLNVQDGVGIPPVNWTTFRYVDLIETAGLERGRAKSRSTLIGLGVPDTRGGGIYAYVIRFPETDWLPDCRYLAYIGETDRPLVDRFREYPNDEMNENGKGRIHIWNLIYLFWDRLEYWCSDQLPDGFTTAKQLESHMLSRVLPPFNKKFPAGIERVARVIYES